MRRHVPAVMLQLGLVLCACLMPVPAPAGVLPDLVLEDLAVGGDCSVSIKLANRGTAALPTSAYPSATLTIGTSFTRTLEGVDLSKVLSPPGGTLTFVPSGIRIDGTKTLSVTIDATHVVAESNESNNSITRTLTCTTPLPDLALTSLGLASGCRPSFRVKNVGTTVAQDSIFNAQIQRTFDGLASGVLRLGTLDPAHVLKNPGGEITYVEPDYRVYGSYLYKFIGAFTDANAGNNAFVQGFAIGNPCVSTRPPHDLQPYEASVRWDTNRCVVALGLRNNGPGPMHPAVLDPANDTMLKILRDGQVDSWPRLNVESLKAPGSTLHHNYAIPLGTWQVRFILQGSVADANPSNDELTKTVTCAAPPSKLFPGPR